MLINEIFAPVTEYERDTPRAEKIQQTLTRAGYRMLGGGAEATAWGREDGPVIKVIMPSEGSGTDLAMKSFLRFYKLTRKKPSLHWPRFQALRDEAGRVSDFAEFTIDGKKYVQIGVERLAELSYGESEIIEDMANSIQQGWSLEKWAFRYMDWYKQEYPQEIRALKSQLPTLWAAMKTAYGKTGGNYLWDLHGGNAMKRRDGTIVITDPFIRWDQ